MGYRKYGAFEPESVVTVVVAVAVGRAVVRTVLCWEMPTEAVCAKEKKMSSRVLSSMQHLVSIPMEQKLVERRVRI